MSEPRYAERWLFRDRKPLNVMTAAKAEKRHDERDGYIAMLGDPEKPSHIIHMNGPRVTVSFLDDDLREYLSYAFKEARPGELFLSQAIFREYGDGSGELESSLTFTFEQDGRIAIERRDLATEEIETSRATADTAPNWDRYPAFGRYEHLALEERDLPQP